MTSKAGNRSTVRTALITGVTGQDGHHLAPYLLESGYAVHGSTRGTPGRAAPAGVQLHTCDLLDGAAIAALLNAVQPDEIYHLGGLGDVGASFADPHGAFQANGTATVNLLECVRRAARPARLLHASSAHLMSTAGADCITEETPIVPTSPYAIAKSFAHHHVRLYREQYGQHASNAILFNHESPLRSVHYVTGKVAATLAHATADSSVVLSLGNLDAGRDWSDAGDVVRGMHAMLQQEEPGDYVLASGQMHSVREFIEVAAERAGFTLRWEGTGVDETGVDASSGRVLVRINPTLFRPVEVSRLAGNPGKARRELGWEAQTTFRALVHRMVDAHLAST